MATKKEQAPREETGPDDLLIRDAGSKSILSHIFFRASQEVSHEQGQALARIAIIGLGLLGISYDVYRNGASIPSQIAAGYFVFSIAYLKLIAIYKHRFLWRRYLMIVLDLSFISYLTYFYDLSGLVFYPLFLWVMIGNGLRFGAHYLRIATWIGITGFTSAMWGNGLLFQFPLVFGGLLAGLALMPKFFFVMVQRLSEANLILKSERDKAEHMASHDALTGLPNRAQLDVLLSQALSRARRNTHHVAVAFIDLDSFKSINDSFGHPYGDRLLTELATCISRELRTSDTVARLGGDEFIIVIDGCENWATISAVIERIFTCVGRYYLIGEYETYVTWSCGIAVYPDDGKDSETLIKNADTAMYRAKALGTNRYVFYDQEMSRQVGENLAMRDELRQAIDRQQFVAYYQPIIDAGTGNIIAAEALVRWAHPERGLIPPFKFIEVAEQTGLIDPIGNWMLETSILDAVQLRNTFGEDFRIHVNVSAFQLKQEGLLERVEELLSASTLPAQSLELEMTESGLIEDIQKVETLLGQFKSIGVTIALDDFGTGYSSLSYLKRLSVDTIKIDRSFIRDIPVDSNDCSLVDTIITIGTQMGCNVIAEGVETEEQKHWLMQHNCKHMQGYVYARPMPLEQLLSTGRS